MRDLQLPKAAKLAFLAVCVLFIGSIAITILHITSFRIVSTSASTKTLSTISPFFVVTYNEDLSPDAVTVTSSPDVTDSNVTINGKNLTIPFTKKMNSVTTYTITIAKVRSTSGRVLTNQTVSFKPTYVASQDLPSDQQKKLISQQSGGSINANDPIVPHLPYQTAEFSLAENTQPQVNTKDFPLQATITLAQSDMGNEHAAVNTYEQDVVSYIQSLGLNPSNYNITYIIQKP